jgi:transcriptional regulator with XRE-family HTH domain
MDFSKKLHELRLRAGLSQSELAQASGIPVWTLRGYEQGRREPLWEVLFTLADSLGVAVDEFRACLHRASRPSANPRRRRPASTVAARAEPGTGRARLARPSARSK